MKRIAILGSTGSIGVNALSVISAHSSSLAVAALSANRNIHLLKRQIEKYHPAVVSVCDEDSACRLKRSIRGNATAIVWGERALSEIVRRKDVDTVLCAISGIACLKPLLSAIDAKKRIALANKESLVAAGPIVMERARRMGVVIIPVDSEHNAVFQCLEGGKRRYLKKIYLTGTGGPLWKVRHKRPDALSSRFMLEHPKWRMGRKISVDSATMMNKGLEVIEARWLFDVKQSSIDVVIHPEAIVHSMVEFLDGSIMAEMAVPDMRLPIQYALTYPERRQSVVKELDLAKVGSLTFLEPDTKRFPCLALARRSLEMGKTYPAVLSASDEEAVRFYLEGAIRFSDIHRVIERIIARHRPNTGALSVDAVFEADRWAREEVRALCNR